MEHGSGYAYKKIMILGASRQQVSMICKAKEYGLYVIAVDYDQDAIGFQYADKSLVVSTIDKEAVLEQVKIYKPDYITTSISDMPVRTVAYVNQMIGKKGDFSYEDALCVTNKFFMRERLKNNGVPCPRFDKASSQAEFIEKAKSYGDMFVVKPADNAGSRGVRLVSGQENLQDVYREAKQYSRCGDIMIEEYMEGAEVSVEALTANGATTIVAITDKIVTEPPYFVELGHAEPSRLPGNLRKEIEKITKAAIKAMNISDSPTHTEVKLTKEGPKIVEIASRLGGDCITSKLVPLSTGVDMPDNSLRIVMGMPLDLEQKSRRGGAAVLFLTGKAGIVRDISGIEKACKGEGVESVELYCKTGDTILDLKNSNHRLGHVVAVGKTQAEALENCKRALEMIKIDIEPAKRQGEIQP